MADTTIKLRTAPGTIPYNQIDLTTRAVFVEEAPKVYDARPENQKGKRFRSRKAVRRRVSFKDIQRLTDIEVSILRRWAHEGVKLGINPNWNDATTFLARYARPADDGTPGVMIGPNPTFTRASGHSLASATQLREDGKFALLANGVPRYEQSSIVGSYFPLLGMRPYGRHSNYFDRSYPQSGQLVWTLTNTSGVASWTYSSTVDSHVAGVVGSGLLLGNSGDYISKAISSYGGAGSHSFGVWLRGEGTVTMQLTGGATATSSSFTLNPKTWTLLKLENQTTSGASVTVRVNLTATKSWCFVGGAMMQKQRRLSGYYHNLSGALQELGYDNLSYNYQVPFFAMTIHVGLQMPDLVASGEQGVLGMNAGGGEYLTLRYDGGSNVWFFCKRSTANGVTWTPQKSAGFGTILSLYVAKDIITAYENNALVAGAAISSLVQQLPIGLKVGWDGVDDTRGWNGLIYFVRIDEEPINATEIQYITERMGNSQLEVTRMAEGRLFEIETPAHRINLDTNFASLDLIETDSFEEATTEEP